MSNLSFKNPGFNVAPIVKMGTFYNKSTWTDLTDFTYDSGYTITDNAILSPADATYSKNLYLTNQYSGLFEWEIRMNVTYKVFGGTNYGGGIYLKSGNNTVNNSLKFYIFGIAGADFGKLVVYDVYKNKSYQSATAISGYAIGQDYDMIVTKTKTSYVYSVLYQGTTTTLTLPRLFDSSTNDISNNTFSAGFQASTGTYQINSFKFSSDELRFQNVWVGDSLSDGFNGGSYGATLGALVGAQINAGAGDKIREVLLRIPEIISMRPPKVYLMIGTNNSFDGTFQTDYQSAVTQLQNAKINVVPVTPPASTSVDRSAMASWIMSTYPTIAKNGFAATKNSGDNFLNPAYNTDGIHLNAAGFQAIATAVLT